MIETRLVGHTQLRDCPDCKTSHIGKVPCGLSYRDRLRSTRLDSSATPSRDRRNYYDSEAISGIFGADAHERMLEETEGVGYVTPEEFAALPEDKQQDVAAFYGADPEDSRIIAGG